MVNNIISYFEMCTREGTSLQHGMNFRLRGGHSVILMSVRANAPYRDRVEEDGTVLVYEGHDIPRSADTPLPKTIDQPMHLPSGGLSRNGKFYEAALAFKRGDQEPDLARVYEKIKKGIWSDNGFFQLVDAWIESDERRNVFRFKLIAVEADSEEEVVSERGARKLERRRIIPTAVKLEVWRRDGGKCVMCGAADELHFDHILPFAKGGTSFTAENVQLLCARHNLEKSAKIV